MTLRVGPALAFGRAGFAVALAFGRAGFAMAFTLVGLRRVALAPLVIPMTIHPRIAHCNGWPTNNASYRRATFAR